MGRTGQLGPRQFLMERIGGELLDLSGAHPGNPGFDNGGFVCALVRGIQEVKRRRAGLGQVWSAHSTRSVTLAVRAPHGAGRRTHRHHELEGRVFRSGTVRAAVLVQRQPVLLLSGGCLRLISQVAGSWRLIPVIISNGLGRADGLDLFCSPVAVAEYPGQAEGQRARCGNDERVAGV